MPSPFPGMNPYLEQDSVWPDFHTKFLTEINEQLVAQVRPRYIVLMDQHLYLHQPADESRRLIGRGDVSLAHVGPAAAWATGAAVLEAPVEVAIPRHDVERVSFLKIRDRRGRDLVAVVELLSPSNKRGDDRTAYLTKRGELFNSPAHLVEIDLLRGGQTPPLEDRPHCDYSVMLSRVDDRPRAGFWPIALPDPLPRVPVPLRNPDPDAAIDLQAALHRVYDRFGYEDFLYDAAPQPGLTAEQAAWAEAFLPK